MWGWFLAPWNRLSLVHILEHFLRFWLSKRTLARPFNAYHFKTVTFGDKFSSKNAFEGEHALVGVIMGWGGGKWCHLMGVNESYQWPKYERFRPKGSWVRGQNGPKTEGEQGEHHVNHRYSRLVDVIIIFNTLLCLYSSQSIGRTFEKV